MRKLIEVLQKLSMRGNTVLVIEHNLDIIKTADYLIDLGPEGGERSGEIVCCGTPEEVAKCDRSYDGKIPEGQACHVKMRPAAQPAPAR